MNLAPDPWGGRGVLVSVHHRTVYVSTALWLVNHLVRFVVSTPETKASHHQLLGCPWLQSQLAWKKERKREYPLHPCLPTPIHSSRPSSLHYKPVEQINIFYKNSNGSQKKKMVSKLTMHIWLADLIAQSFSTRTSGQVCPGGSSRLTAFAF